VQWAEVASSCPLCKTQFRSVIHNVRANDDYEKVIMSHLSAHLLYGMCIVRLSCCYVESHDYLVVPTLCHMTFSTHAA